MASMSSETSYWIKFFTDASIPAGDSAHYAIMFADNRISREMLLDLSKEYLTDMGITRLGDIIAILKHAKKVHNQEAKDMLLKSSSMTLRSSSPSVNSPRRSTAASRMVNHFTSKHPEAVPMSQQPTPRPATPDPPNSKRKVSVFDRLGAEGGDSDITVSVPQSSLQSGSNSVFSRLGGKSAMKRPASSTSIEQIEKGDRGLPYVGVLKGTPSPSPKKKMKKAEVLPTVQISNVKKKDFGIKKTIKSSDIGEITISNIQRPEVSTSTEGVLSAFARKETPSLRDRLGSKTEMPSSTTNISLDKANTAKKGKVSVQNRLGAKREELSSSPVVSSTQQINVKLKRAKEISIKAAKQDSEKTSGVFSRLGKMSKV